MTPQCRLTLRDMASMSNIIPTIHLQLRYRSHSRPEKSEHHNERGNSYNPISGPTISSKENNKSKKRERCNCDRKDY